MNNTTNHKIKKYQYKLAHAANKKEAALYKAKLDSYKSRQAGGEIKEEELRDMINKAFTGSEQQVANLASQFDALIEEIRKKCCEKKDCGPETLAQIAKLEEDFRVLLNRELMNKDRDLSKKLSAQKEELEKKLKEPCPPTQAVAQMITDKPLDQQLVSFSKTAIDDAPAVNVAPLHITEPDVVPLSQSQIGEIKGGLFESPSPYETEFSIFGSQAGGKRRKKQTKK